VPAQRLCICDEAQESEIRLTQIESQTMTENEPLTFDKAATGRLAQAANEVIAAHPEVRSVVVAIDYRGNLNTAAVDRVVWLGDKGQVIAPDAVIGSLQAVITATQFIVERAVIVEQSLRGLVTESAVRLTDQLNKAVADIGAKNYESKEFTDYLATSIRDIVETGRNFSGTTETTTALGKLASDRGSLNIIGQIIADWHPAADRGRAAVPAELAEHR